MNNSQYRRLIVVAAGIGVVMLIVVGRLFAFQITQGEVFKENLITELPVTDQDRKSVV